MTDKYILDDKNNVVPCNDLLEWAAWFEANHSRRRVDFNQVGDYKISTVFLGLDHRFTGDGPPILFETMVFKGKDAGGEEQERCCTWDEAVEMHHKMVAKYRRLTK